MFFRIGEDRFKMSSVTRYVKGDYTHATKKFYIHAYFGAKEKIFTFNTKSERDKVLEYLDKVFKVQTI